MRRRELYKRAALIASAVITAFALSEFVLLPKIIGLPYSAVKMGFVSTQKVIDGVRINGIGLTGDVPSLIKKPGVIRILTLGSSTLFNRNMTERLKSRLNEESGSTVEVVGAALRLHTSRSDIEKYKYLAKYKFDYVLICNGINDLLANHVAIKDYRQDYSHIHPKYNHIPLLSQSVIFRIFYSQFFFKPAKYIHNGSNFMSIGTFEKNLNLLVDLVRANGAKPILMSFPYYIPKDYSRQAFFEHELGYNNPRRYDEIPVRAWGSVSYVRKGLSLINRSIRRVAKRKNALFIDQYGLMKEDIGYFGDVCHPSEKGVDVFIGNIADFLAAHKML